MKVYNSTAYQLNLPPEQVTNTWDEDCTHVFFDGDIGPLLQRWTPSHRVQHFVAASNFSRTQSWSGKLENCEHQFLLEFKNEKVTEVSDKIRQLLEGVPLTGNFGDLKNYLALIGTELVQNALIHQNQQQSIQFKLVLGKEQVQIWVTDTRGGLEFEQVMGRLKRCQVEGSFEEKKQGAGLGLYMVSRNCDQMIFRVNDHQQTQVICSIQRYTRLKDFKQKSVSIHYIKENA